MPTIRLKALGAIIAVVAALGQPAAAQDKVKVGVFPTRPRCPISWQSSAASSRNRTSNLRPSGSSAARPI